MNEQTEELLNRLGCDLEADLDEEIRRNPHNAMAEREALELADALAGREPHQPEYREEFGARV